MAKFNFWNFRNSLDDIFFELVNFILKSSFLLNKILGKKRFLKRNKELENSNQYKRVFIIGNGPSLMQQDIKALSKEITIFVNRGFMHEDYSIVQPTYHIFVDPKLASGEWEITMLDEIVEKNPKVIFLLNSKWYHLDKFKPYIADSKYKIYWLDIGLFFTSFYNNKPINLTSVTYGLGVAGQAIASALYMGADKVYLLGMESTGFCNELMKENSHFYGVNPENNKKNMQDVYKDLYFNYLYIKSLYFFSVYCTKQGYVVVNCTLGGILNMFERRNYKEVLND